jgi:cobyrinic acid a,c-diamide synthase
MPVYAECGGFIYLTRGIVDSDPGVCAEGSGGQVLSSEGSDGWQDLVDEDEGLTPFVGIFPAVTRMRLRRKALGYREVEFATDTIIGPAGTNARGHEFHYSEMEEMPEEVGRVFRLHRRGTDLGSEGYLIGNCLASYVHLHFGSNPGLAEAFVESCRQYRPADSGD